jgi:hypothetical protein
MGTQQALDRGHFRAPTDKIRLSTRDSAVPFRQAQQPLRPDGLIGAFDVHKHQWAPPESLCDPLADRFSHLAFGRLRARWLCR